MIVLRKDTGCSSVDQKQKRVLSLSACKCKFMSFSQSTAINETGAITLHKYAIVIPS